MLRDIVTISVISNLLFLYTFISHACLLFSDVINRITLNHQTWSDTFFDHERIVGNTLGYYHNCSLFCYLLHQISCKWPALLKVCICLLWCFALCLTLCVFMIIINYHECVCLCVLIVWFVLWTIIQQTWKWVACRESI